jgi:hypothetical protein
MDAFPLLTDQEPPEVLSVRVIDDPVQTVAGPDKADTAGNGVTFTTA